MTGARGQVVVVGTLAANPYAGMAWMHMQIVVGLVRLGYDAYYFECSSDWPYDPIRQRKVGDSEYAAPYLQSVAESFGVGERWAYRRSYSDKAWLGPAGARAERLLATADATLNVAGATVLSEEGLTPRRCVYFGTDPVVHEAAYAAGDAFTRTLIDAHDDCVTYGENIGQPDCVIPPLPRLRATTRQPVLMDMWRSGPPRRDTFTTVGNWQQLGRDVCLDGKRYHWSKHHEFLKFVDVPARTKQPIELAVNLAERLPIRAEGNEAVPAIGLIGDGRTLLEQHGWTLADAAAFSRDPWAYREYVRDSRGEFTVARDLNVRTRSGWFSERSACYLAAGRPVITQDTGLRRIFPTGEGLFVFDTVDDVDAAFDAIQSDYPKHSQAAQAIAHEYFDAETVLTRLMAALGIG